MITSFKKAFRVSRETFAAVIEILKSQYRESHKKGGRPPKVPKIDRSCIFFA